MTITTYREIKRQAVKNLPCPKCGRKVRRQKTFSMTLNPWNKNPDGTVRSAQDIVDALNTQAREWTAEPAGCSEHACESCGKVADHDTELCCSSHGKRLCHQCYRRTHFVQVCGCGRTECQGSAA